jgi:hypothetical protein
MSCSEELRTVLPRAQPALLIRTVGLPKAALTAEAALVMEEWDARSTWKYFTLGGAAMCELYSDSSEFDMGVKRTFVCQLLHV